MVESMRFVLIFLLSVFISSVSQIALKKSAKKTYKAKSEEYLNPIVIISYAVFFLSSLLTVYAYKGIDLSLGPVLEATGYIYIVILARIILKEKLTKKKIAGNLIIILGIIVFSM